MGLPYRRLQPASGIFRIIQLNSEADSKSGWEKKSLKRLLSSHFLHKEIKEGIRFKGAFFISERRINMEQNHSNPLATEPVGKLLLKFSVPTALTLMVNYMYNIVDQIFVGQNAGYLGIAATNVAFPLSTICVAIALLIGDGCAANISLHLGRKEYEKANHSFANAFALLIAFGIFVLVGGNVFLKQLVLLFGATENVFNSAMSYSRIILFGLPFMIFNVSFTAIIRADGNPKYTMKCMMLGALINVVLDPIFIFTFDMGVVGAAIATIIGQIAAGVLCLLYIPKLKNVSFSVANMRLKADTCKEILTLGIPSFFTQISAALTQIVMNNLMKTYGASTIYGSDIALSCYGMVMKIYQVAHSMFVGVSSGTQPINGFNYGAKQYGRVKKTYSLAIKVALVISIIWYLLFRIFSGTLGGLFVPGNELYSQFTQHFINIYMAVFFIYGPPMSTASFFQAIGKPVKSLLISLSRQAFFLIPLALILSNFFGLDGALAAAPIADTLTLLLAVILVVREFKFWKANNMI